MKHPKRNRELTGAEQTARVPVTAETIAPAQIDWVYVNALGSGSHHQAEPDLMHACTVAHNTHGDFTAAEQAAALVTVTAAWNARRAKETSNGTRAHLDALWPTC